MSNRAPGSATAATVNSGSARATEAASRLFSQAGFHGTTTRDIATAAGMTSAGLYFHFGSKEEILYAISRDAHQRALALMKDASQSHHQSIARLTAVVRALVLHHAREHKVAKVANFELSALTPTHWIEIAALRQEIQGELQAVVEAGQAAGDFSEVRSDMTAAAVLSLCIDVTRWYRDGRSWKPDDIADHFATLAVRMVSDSIAP